ncbi:outer membrane beta-barrel protein [Chitinophagaceae bacterium MMS25-I14]
MRTFLLFLFSFSCLITSAQSGGISGTVHDAAGKRLAGATVVAMQAKDRTLVKSDMCNEQGDFKIAPLADGDYLLQATLYGFEVYTSEVLHVNGAVVTIPEILLREKSKALNDVTIRGQKPLIEVQADKIVVNVENSIVNTNSSVLEVLSRSPGVTVDQNDNISLKGKQGVTIMIDGKLVPISGADLANMLKGMSSDNVEKIELISNPSARYDAAGNAGIINIRTKKDKRMGANGSINAGYGQGVYPKYNAGFNLNYRAKKINLYSTYNYAYRKGMNDLYMDKTFYQGGVVSGAYQQHNYLVFPFNNHMATLGADYTISSKTSVGASFTGGINNYAPKGSAYSRVLDADMQTQSFFGTNNDLSNRWKNYTVNLNFRHSFDSAGTELSVDADYARYWNNNRQDYITHYYLSNGNEDPVQSPYVLHGDLSGLTQIRSVKADYVHPMQHNIRLEAGVKTSFVTADNQSSFYDRSNGGNVFDVTKSNHFIYNENINAVYVNAYKEWEKWSLQLGARVEQTNVKGEQKVDNTTFEKQYAQLFPSLSLHRKVNKDNDLGLTLSRRIERPNYDQLNPFKFYLDPSSYKEGNPYLDPSLTYAVELSHTYKGRFITTISYSRSDKVITQVIQPVDTIQHITLITDKNLARMTYIGISGAYPLQPFKWWNSTNSINFYYSHFEGDLANTHLDKGSPVLEFNTSNSFILPHNWSAELGGFFQSAQVYGYMYLKPIWMVNLGVQKNLLDKRATVKLSITDIFWHGNPVGTNTYEGYYESFRVKRDTRAATLSFTYRFGKRTVAPIRRRSSGAEDEIKRAGSGGI